MKKLKITITIAQDEDIIGIKEAIAYDIEKYGKVEGIEVEK